MNSFFSIQGLSAINKELSQLSEKANGGKFNDNELEVHRRYSIFSFFCFFLFRQEHSQFPI